MRRLPGGVCMEEIMALRSYVEEEREYLTQMRRYFHAHPEVSMKEYNTCKQIEEELDRMGISHRRVGETGVYGWIDGKKEAVEGDRSSGHVVALRADIDALAMEELK